MRRHADLLAVVVLSALLALWSNRWSDGDLITATWFFDAATGAFPLRRQWLLSSVLHDGLKWLAVVVWVALLAGWAVLRLRGAAAELRGRLAFVLVASLLAVIAVNLARAQSAHSCPWYVGDFGGRGQYFRLLEMRPTEPGPGKCLPSGHAATAFMWLALLPVLTGARRRLALGGVLLLGGVAGAVQLARGAHFPSHILLSAALCALVVWICAVLARK
ncbi:phosphatase PAP2 family protein [Methyloversatilis discipulorum]|uniref:phosphatase PAP2 family protein n=1 Tax=Methyloversatilis discipulorum TaxID=1119528 RepID=UPI001A514749|nr:phosphatase PAP2 family protein [Methyloversatilis discipulorum]MBL8469823.1 phosphatase PAP2 family protein [Methyloversatilis discipulorum]